jgi:hypothetical protein
MGGILEGALLVSDDPVVIDEPVGVTIARIWSPDEGPRDVTGLVQQSNDGTFVSFGADATLNSGDTLEVTVQVRLT